MARGFVRQQHEARHDAHGHGHGARIDAAHAPCQDVAARRSCLLSAWLTFRGSASNACCEFCLNARGQHEKADAAVGCVSSVMVVASDDAGGGGGREDDCISTPASSDMFDEDISTLAVPAELHGVERRQRSMEAQRRSVSSQSQMSPSLVSTPTQRLPWCVSE
jgi:hypothetical protein